MQNFCTVVRHAGGTFPCQHPNTVHLRDDLTLAIRTHSTTWAVADFLRTAHGTGHAGRMQRTHAAHSTVEDRTFGDSLASLKIRFQSREANHAEKRRRGPNDRLNREVYQLKKSWVILKPTSCAHSSVNSKGKDCWIRDADHRSRSGRIGKGPGPGCRPPSGPGPLPFRPRSFCSHGCCRR